MSLQLIFENALKYNEITHRYPLDIDIYAEVGAVIVENSYHPADRYAGGIFRSRHGEYSGNLSLLC